MSNDWMAALRRVHNRVMLTVARAVVAAVSDGDKMQLVQLGVLAGEVRDGVERFQNYGFTSVPKAGAEAAVMFVGGNRDHGLVVAVDDRRYRLTGLQSGEVAIYTDEGDSIVLGRGNVVTVTTKTFKVNAETAIELTAPQVTIAASTGVQLNTPLASVSGDVVDNSAAGGKSMASMRTIYDSHTHHENNVSGGNTDAPNQPM